MGFLAFSTPNRSALRVCNPCVRNLKKFDAVGVAVRCKPSRGCFATPTLIPASKIGRISTPIFLEKPFSASSVQNRPISRSNPACLVFSLPFLQNRNTGRNFGSQGRLWQKKKTAGCYSYDLRRIYFLFHFHGWPGFFRQFLLLRENFILPKVDSVYTVVINKLF